MTPVDYIGRQFDVLAFRNVQEAGSSELAQSLFNAESGQTIFDAVVGGEVCTGIQKLSQRWVLEFATTRGSMGFHLSNRGSDFMRWVRQGRLRTEFDVQTYFNFAAQQVRTQLVNEETPDMNPEERLDQALLGQIALFDGVLQMSITISSQAGENRQVILPIPIIPTNITI